MHHAGGDCAGLHLCQAVDLVYGLGAGSREGFLAIGIDSSRGDWFSGSVCDDVFIIKGCELQEKGLTHISKYVTLDSSKMRGRERVRFQEPCREPPDGVRRRGRRAELVPEQPAEG